MTCVYRPHTTPSAGSQYDPTSCIPLLCSIRRGVNCVTFLYIVNHAVLWSTSQCICSYSLQAANHSLVYPDYAWIIYLYASSTGNEDQDACTDEDILNFLNMSRALMMHILPEPEDDNVQTNTGFVSLSSVLEIFIFVFEIT